MDSPASATLRERLRAHARFRAEEAGAPFAESSKQEARWFVQKAAGRVWFSGYVSRRRQRTGRKTDTEKPSAPEKMSIVLMRIFRGDGSRQSRNTQSIKRSFVRWVYFALNRRGLDLSGFRRHVSLCLSHFRFSLSALTGTCHVPVGIRQGKDHQRKSAGTPRLSRYFCLASSRSFSNSAVLYSV